jgi:manganese/zinc/iron transport system ATP- binding protein
MFDTNTKRSTITISHLFVGYEQTDILHDVSLEIPGGVFLPLVGPNGAGKTTLLRTILGLIKPRKGNVVTALKRSDFGYVPQHRSIDPLYPVTTQQIVLMGLYPKLGPWRRLRGSKKERVQTIMEDLDLSGAYKQDLRGIVRRNEAKGTDRAGA